MRLVACALAVAGCGRIGFGESDAVPGTGDAAADASLDAGLILHLTFDNDVASGPFNDVTGHGHVATCTALQCPTLMPGKIGAAVRFDGGGQHAIVAHAAELDTAAAFTLAAWLYLEDASVDQLALGRQYRDLTDDTMAIVAWQGSQTCMLTTSATAVEEDVCTGFPFGAGGWHHIVGMWDGANKSIWYDGFRKAQVAGNVVGVDNHGLVIGADMNLGAAEYFWHGLVDEVRLYDRALTDVEINALAHP